MKKSITLNILRSAFVVLTTISFGGCEKFLDQKPQQSQIVPRTVDDLQRLLDNRQIMNQSSSGGYSEMIADNYYVPNNIYQQLNAARGTDRYTLNYAWALNAEAIPVFWDATYRGPIYYSNIVLDHLANINNIPEDSNEIKTIKGAALFFRAFAFYNLAQLYCQPYSVEYLSLPGIVLRLTSDAAVIDRKRATIKETYDKIITDLKEAAAISPENITIPTRPGQTAAYAALARVYLSMREYEYASQYANLALQQQNILLDYNDRMPLANPRFQNFNPEIIFDDVAYSALLPNAGFSSIDTLLYQSYDSNDLRKVLFFGLSSGRNVFMGSYNTVVGNFAVFNGFATDELYLIRAECSARAGDKELAMADLNHLLRKRWTSDVVYEDMTAVDGSDALEKVLTERRKELLYRGQRWTDIRRLNLEGANITLRRNIAGTIYTLPPNDLRAVMLIPDEEIARSGIEQNPR